MQAQKEVLSLNDKIKFDNKGGSILGILEGPVADYKNPTRNGRLYGEKLWENVIHDPFVMEQFKNGGIVGELDHPVDRDETCTEKVAVIMPELPVKNPRDGKYYGKFNILDTPCGKIVYTLAKAGFKFGVSSRGVGDVDEYTDEVNPDSYEFKGFDIVLLPAVESARMTLVTESLDTKKVDYKKLLKESIDQSSDSDKKVMTETLNNLGIKLDEDKEKQKCVICGKPIVGYGNNALPVAEGNCCDQCNQNVVIPARLKDLQNSKLNEDKKEDKEEQPEKFIAKDSETDEIVVDDPKIEAQQAEEKTELPDVELKNNLLEPETIDDIELEKDNNICEVSDAKLLDLLHTFLKGEGLELDGEGEEEKHFIELFHEIVCPNCSDTDEKSVDDINDEEVQKDEPEVADSESDELIEQLQTLLKENVNLKDEIKKLQSEKAVSGTKVNKLNEELDRFKSIAASAGRKALELKSSESKTNSLIDENKSLKEQLEKTKKQVELQETRISKLNESKETLTNKATENSDEIKKLKESLETTKQNSNRKLTEANEKIIKAKKLIEKYKSLAHETADRYIERRAIALGINKNEILNKLNESYTLDDVDKLCEELQDYSLNISRLPFAFDKPGKAKVRIREDRSRDPLQNIDNQYDDEVDDYLLDLAGLKK